MLAHQAALYIKLSTSFEVINHQQTQILLYTIISGEIIGYNRL